MDSFSKYILEMTEIMEEVKLKMLRVKEIKEELEKLKIIPTKSTTNDIKKITCDCGCIIKKNSWYSHIKTKKHLKKSRRKSR